MPEQSGSKLWAAIPIKPRGQAKSRLSSALSNKVLAELFKSMLRDVLTALRDCADIDEILLITSQARGSKLAGEFDAHLFEDNGTDGLNESLHKAADYLTTEKRVDKLLLLHGDLPLISPEDISFMVSQHQLAPSLTLAPDLTESGTNAMLISPPKLIPFHYGPDSFRLHLAAIQALGIKPNVIHRPGLGLDIDLPADLKKFVKSSSGGYTKKLLAKTKWQSRI